MTSIGESAFSGCLMLTDIYYTGTEQQKNVTSMYNGNYYLLNATWHYKYVRNTSGDINGDKKVNNKDLVRLFRYLSKWSVEVNETALDVNGEGSVDNKDLTRLFRYLSDWEVEIF